MVNQPPKWAKDAVISLEGWRHPKTGELLICRKFNKAQIEEYRNFSEFTEPFPVQDVVRQEVVADTQQTDLIVEQTASVAIEEIDSSNVDPAD